MKTSLVLPLLLLGLAGDPSMLPAQSAGTFSATGSMIMPRFGHTATLLPNGKVLIAGGYTDALAPSLPSPESGHAITATAELYDPSTGTFTAAGNMITARAYHSATVLPDGRVLIAAGWGRFCCVNLAGAELYDPSTGTFSATGSMTTLSGGYNTATLLPDGRVLITGLPSSVELYDPALGTFTVTGNMTVPPQSVATATLLPNGRVLLLGDFNPSLYDPVTGGFSLTGTATDSWSGKATLLKNGKVLVAGGSGDPGPSPGAHVYDPSTGTFTFTGNMAVPRAYGSVTLLPDGRALVIGGGSSFPTDVPGGTRIDFFCCIASAELYDTAEGVFMSTGSMAAGRADHTATLLNSGQVLIAGGGPSNNAPALATAELYNSSLLLPPPVLLSLQGDGRGQGAIQHAGTYELVTADRPAVAGEIIIIYCEGLSDGGAIPPQVAIGGRIAEVLWFGKTSGFVGLNQINVRVPSGVAPGPAVPIHLTYLGRPSNEVATAVQ